MGRKVKKLVVDTAAFVKHVPLWEHAEEFYCVSDVIKEIRDRQTRHHVDALPFRLQFREPSSSSVKFINDFTKQTGDFASLSLADVKVLALTYELEVEAKGTSSHLRTEPLVQRTEQVASKRPPLSGIQDNIEGFYCPKQVPTINFYSSKKREDSTELDEISCSSIESEEVEEEYTVCDNHFHQLNEHLAASSYIKGPLITEVDVIVFLELIKRFSLLKRLSQLAVQHRSGAQWRLWQSICLNYSLEFPSSALDPSSSKNEGFAVDECESLQAAREFNLHYGAWPHFNRWFLHLLSFSETELGNVERTATGSGVSLKEVFVNISNLNDEKSSEDSTANSENNLEDEFQNLEVKSVSNEETKEKDELVATNKTQFDEPSDTCCNESDEIEENGEEAEIEYVEEENEEEEEEEDNDYDSSYESDDEEGWITPSSLKAMKSQKDDLDDDLMKSTDVACITSDYSMQNTLKHIGLEVMGVDGKLISSLRTFILRCFACGKTTDKLERLFCQYCGHKTLKKVSVTLNPDGTQRIWISTRKPINIRGTKYSLPRPRGGKHGINPILVADQRRVQQRVTKQCRKRNDPMDEDYDARCGVFPFLTRDVYSRSAQLGIKQGKKQHRGVFYWEQRNPNVPLNKGTRKKKR